MDGADHRSLGRELSNWGRWGSDDQLGTLNLLTPERVLAGARSIRHGRTIELSMPLDEDGPQIGAGPRTNPVHIMTRLPSAPPEASGFHYFDDALFLHLQGATQLDTLAHVAYDGLLYNGVGTDQVTSKGALRLGMEHLVGRLNGRAVLLDIPRSQGRDRLDAGEPVTTADLEHAEQAAGVTVGSGDMLLVRTGWLGKLAESGDREAFFSAEPGLDLGTARWLRERDVAFVGADNWGVEVAPSASGDAMPLHCVLIRDMGMPLGEMFVLDELAHVAADLGTGEFHLSCAGLRITGAVGSPVSPVATF
jgi:kynurenine formamidase